MTHSEDAGTGRGRSDTEPRPPEVVAGLNGSASDAAVVEWAADEAVRLGVPLRLVHVIDPGVQLTPYPALLAGMPSLAEDLDGEAHELLDAGVEQARARHPSLEVHTSVPWGPPGGALRDLSADARRIVIGGSRSPHLERLLLGSVAVPVVAHARCPVAVVPVGTTSGPARQVVVGVDGSPCSSSAVEVALASAADTGAAVTCVMGWSTEVVLGVVVSEPLARQAEEVEADCRAVAHAVVDPIAARHPSVPVTVEVRHGRPADAVIEVADELDADLVVVGSRGHGGFVGLLLGSVSRRVVDHAGRVVVVAH